MRQIIFFFFFLIGLQVNAQEGNVFTVSGISVLTQVGTAEDIYNDFIPRFSVETFQIVEKEFDREQNKSFAAGIGFEKITNNLGFRLMINRIKIDITKTFIRDEDNFSPISSFFFSRTDKREQINYEIIPGFHRYFQQGRWTIAAGLELRLNIYGEYIFSERTDNTSTFNSVDEGFITSFENKTELEIPGGFGIGLGTNFGLAYSLSDDWRIGVSYTPGIRGYKIGGESEFLTTTTQIDITTFGGQVASRNETTNINKIPFDKNKSDLLDFYQRAFLTLTLGF